MKSRWMISMVFLGFAACSDDSPTNPNNTATNNTATNNTATNNTSTNNTATNNTATNNTATNNTATNNTSTNNTSTNNMTAPPSPCGDEAPEGLSACTNEGLVCEYGTDPRSQCRILATCESGQWQVILPRCTEIPDATCPATLEDAAGELCDTQDAWCSYEELNCECTNCREFPVAGCQGDPIWVCPTPNTEPNCPVAKPLLGTACIPNALECEYNCGDGGARLCVDNVWTSAEGGPCPISTAKLKTDIEYLGDKELGRLSDELQGLKVASWRYTSPALGEGVRYGIIVEDAPESSAVNINKQMVDLYGMTSLLLADAQVKDAEIKALRAELESLKKSLKTPPSK